MAHEKDFREILWQDGHPVLHNLLPVKDRRPPVHAGEGDVPTFHLAAGGVAVQPLSYDGRGLFVQEDDMTACLRYDEPFYGLDFWHFQEGGGPSQSSSGMGESMVVDPLPAAAAADTSSFAGPVSGSTSMATVTGETPTPGQRPWSAEGRKRTGGGGPEEAEGDSEVVRLEQANAKKPRTGAESSLRRSRSADVHNRSERKRRDKINEKLKALQDLIPRSTKADKASTLDDAIEYLKTLQQQVQMMSMGCGMVPMMFPCMNTGLGMTMSDPMLMFPGNMVPSAAFPPILAAPASASFLPVPAHLGPPGVAPLYHQPNPTLMPQLPPHPNLAYPYQHYPSLHQTNDSS